MKNRKIDIQEKAAKILKKHVNDGQILILNLNDGASIYSKMGSCGGEIAYQFVIINKFDPDYNIKLENNFDLPIYISERENDLLGKGLKLIENRGRLSLLSDEGMIDSSIGFRNQTHQNQIDAINLQKS